MRSARHNTQSRFPVWITQSEVSERIYECESSQADRVVGLPLSGDSGGKRLGVRARVGRGQSRGNLPSPSTSTPLPPLRDRMGSLGAITLDDSDSEQLPKHIGFKPSVRTSCSSPNQPKHQTDLFPFPQSQSLRTPQKYPDRSPMAGPSNLNSSRYHNSQSQSEVSTSQPKPSKPKHRLSSSGKDKSKKHKTASSAKVGEQSQELSRALDC